jgi:dihydroxyacetone kinase-like predicted kinase
MQFLTVTHIQEMLLSGFENIIENKELINSLNVFPVPDSDTGHNMSKTVTGLIELLKDNSYTSIQDITKDLLPRGLKDSQGNSGILLVSFLEGFLESLSEKEEVMLKDLVVAVELGNKKAKETVEKDIPGTMIDCIDELKDTLIEIQGKHIKFSLIDIFEKAIDQNHQALLETKNKMEILKKENVVDAGALGFTLFLHGWYEALSGKTVTLPPSIIFSKRDTEISLKNNKFEVVFIVTNSLFEMADIRLMLDGYGDSLDIIEVFEKIKVHIHTDEYESVKEAAHLIGTVETMNIVNMETNEVIFTL